VQVRLVSLWPEQDDHTFQAQLQEVVAKDLVGSGEHLFHCGQVAGHLQHAHCLGPLPWEQERHAVVYLCCCMPGILRGTERTFCDS
jgi:hypothetical protein